VLFSRDGRSLIVTEKATNKIVTFSLNYAGLPVDHKIIDAPGQTPFGFALGRGRQVLVSQAAGGAPNASSVSSFRIDRDANLTVLDASVATLQSAACWVAVTPDTRFAYVTNTASGTVSGYRILQGGQLQLLNSNGITATTGAGPIDLTFSDGGEYLHVLNSGTHSIETFAVSKRGSLTSVGSFNGLPAGSNGLVAF
jgi:6-phosphogluconolactonase